MMQTSIAKVNNDKKLVLNGLEIILTCVLIVFKNLYCNHNKSILFSIFNFVYYYTISLSGKHKSNLGWSPLHLAAYFGHIDVVEKLLQVIFKSL